jgi:nucleotide-binding universal stress UspA family protein
VYSKILVPLDGSDVAECVLPHVEAIATKNNAVQATFLYVVSPLDMPMVESEFKSRIESLAKSAAEDYVKRVIGKLEYKERAHCEVILGKAADSILDYAQENSMDLIVMASHGLSGVGRWSQGSVTDKVLHESTVPILRIKANAPRSPFYKAGQKMRVLVTLDGSEPAEAVLDQIQKLAGHFGTESTEIVLLRVCELFAEPHKHYPPPMPISWEEYLKHETERAKEICRTYLSEVEERLKKEGLEVRSEVPVGNPAETIVDYADKNSVNLIAMSTHGRTGISKLFLGSVANKVMRISLAPVLLVRYSRS